MSVASRTALQLSAALTPAAVAANTSAEQTFTLTGARLGDAIFATKPTAQAGLAIVGCRVSAFDQVAITFGNLTGAPITPTAAETYLFGIVRA